MNRSLDKWLEIGTVVSAQGLRGELRVYPSSDFPERFLVAGRRWLQNPHTGKISSVELIKGRHIEKKNLYVITLAEINDRNQAEEVRGYKLLVEKSDRLPLEEDEYYVDDLIGLEVYHQLTQEKIGVVKDLFWGGQDILEVELAQKILSDSTAEVTVKTSKRRKLKPKKFKPTTVLIPFVKEIVPVVNLPVGRIEINPPEGLLE